jgi:hypothetical protein
LKLFDFEQHSQSQEVKKFNTDLVTTAGDVISQLKVLGLDITVFFKSSPKTIL